MILAYDPYMYDQYLSGEETRYIYENDDPEQEQGESSTMKYMYIHSRALIDP